MVTGVEHHADYIAEMIAWIGSRSADGVAPVIDAEDNWVETVNERSELTLYPRCNSWYLGANVPGKPRVFMPYIGFPDYEARLNEIKTDDYTGFTLLEA